MICFCAGAAVMALEISGNRFLAPTFGNSVYTWTALIGVVLIALSAGAMLGGHLADRNADPRILALLLLLAAATSAFAPLLHVLIGTAFLPAGLIFGPLLTSLVLLGLPGLMLGAISPFSVRLVSQLTGDTHIGASAGLISMMGSLGSFVGTLLGGYILLNLFDVRAIFFGASILLFALAILALSLHSRPPVADTARMAALMALFLAPALLFSPPVPSGVIYQQETYYHTIRVHEQDEGRVRSLTLDSTTEGAIFTDGRQQLPVRYQNYWQLLALDPSFLPSRALFIGAGAFGMPVRLAQHYPDCHVDVAEIDPAVIEVGEEFFELASFPHVAAHAVDGRLFLQQQQEPYDFIFGDAYNGERYIPPHLATREFFELARDRLNPGGVFMMNVISAAQGEQAELLASMLATLSAAFEHVEIFLTPAPGAASNVILMASDAPLGRFLSAPAPLPPGTPTLATNLLGTRISRLVWPSGGTVMTDLKSPIEALIARSLWQRQSSQP